MLFRQEVLEHRYITELLKDIQRNYSNLEASMQGHPPSAFNLTKNQAILNEVGLDQLALETEMSTSIQEQHQSNTFFDNKLSLENSSDCSSRTGRNLDNLNHEEKSVTMFADQSQKSDQEGFDDSNNSPLTYKSLREQQNQTFCGGSLVSLVNKF